ncbi:MAG: hypothetical protein FD163_676 [Hyphomonadaceae bacterium]|nr:MAG: hypothetical protein FD163_676 [Hyphomonadaceae bacterium]
MSFNECSKIEIISREDEKLTFSCPCVNFYGAVDSYLAEITCPYFCASFSVHSTGFYYDDEFHNSDEADFFETLAKNWRGINGRLEMTCISGELGFAAVSDNKGHFDIEISYDGTKNGPGDFSFKKHFLLEAGELEEVSKRVNKFFAQRSARV